MSYLSWHEDQWSPAILALPWALCYCKGLRDIYQDRFGCQGISPKVYSANIEDNVLPKGTTNASISEAISTFQNAHTKCPKSISAFMGYSQGATLMQNAVSALPEDIRKKLVAGIFFGDTKNKQEDSNIQNYSQDRLASYCAKDDGVCWGELQVTGGHLAYLSNGDG